MKPETIKLVLLVGVVVVALGAVLFMVLRSGDSSGTVQPVPKQMKASSRSGAQPANAGQ